MENHTTIPGRIALIKAELGITEDIEFGKLCGMSKSVVHQLINGQIKSINPVYAYKLEDATGYSAKWIMLGEGPKKTTAFDTNTRAAIAGFFSHFKKKYRTLDLIKFSGLYFSHAAKQRGKFGKPEQPHLHPRP